MDNEPGSARRLGASWVKDPSADYGLWALANGDDALMVEGMMPIYEAL